MKIKVWINIPWLQRKLMVQAEWTLILFLRIPLNLKTVTVRDRIDDGDGKYHYEVNKNETMLAREKQI